MTLMERIWRKVFRCMSQKTAENPILALSPHFIICFIFRSSEGEMTTPRNSMSGTFQAGPVKGPTAMHPAQKIIPKRMPSVVGPTQNFFMRESKALGVSQLHSILYPRDSLAYRSKCHRPGTECNPTRRYLIQPEVFFVSDTMRQMRDGLRSYYSDLSPFDFVICIFRGLPPASQARLPWKCPRRWGKWVWTKKGLGTFATSFRQFTHPQVRSQGFQPYLCFLTLWWLQLIISALILSPGCPDYEWALPHCPRWPPDDSHGCLCTHLYNCVVPSLGRHYGE